MIMSHKTCFSADCVLLSMTCFSAFHVSFTIDIWRPDSFWRPESKVNALLGPGMEAIKNGHPKAFDPFLLDVSVEAVKSNVALSDSELTGKRCRWLHKWLGRARDLRSSESQLKKQFS